MLIVVLFVNDFSLSFQYVHHELTEKSVHILDLFVEFVFYVELLLRIF
jgi:hypothetical protein